MKTYLCFKKLACCFLFSIYLVAFNPGNVIASPLKVKTNTGREKVKALLNIQCVDFLENKGQMRDMQNKPIPFVLFKAEAPGVDLYITEQGLSYVFLETHESEEEREKNEKLFEQIKVSYERVDMLLARASIKKENIIREVESIADFNFMSGQDPANTIQSKKYAKITVKNVYPGIDWVLYSSDKQGFKYDFIIHPEANASDIEIIYKSKRELQLSAAGDLLLKTKRSGLVEKAPYTYITGNNQVIPSRFKILSSSKKAGMNETHIVFEIETKEKITGDMVIDPQLVWSTCYGGNNADGVYCIDTDPQGNLFVCGYGSSANFPIQTAGTYYQTAAAGGFILKFNNGGTLLWATFFGSPGQASGPFVPPSSTSFLATDQNGNVFLCGVVASGVFPLLNASTYYQGTSGGSLDAYIAKFSSNGTLLWSTYYGGSAYDDATGLATDPGGNVFMVGTTQSANFPLQSNSTYFEGTITGNNSGYIVKFDNAGNRIWSSYLRGCGVPKVTSDVNGNIYLTGNTNTLIPLMNPGGTSYYQGIISGTQDAYLLKFTNNGTQLWGSYYGGTTNSSSVVDIGYSITTDKWANVFVTGATTSTNFPVMNPGGGAYFQSNYAGIGNDMFILKFDGNLNRLWATLFGGTRNDSPSESDNLSVDTCGNVWMGFNTVSRNLPFQQACNGGFFDNVRDTSINASYSNIYLARFSNNGNLLWSSFFGGDGDSHRCTWDTDKFGNAFMIGEFNLVTNISTYPTLNAGGTTYFSGNVGGDDLAIAKFSGGQAAAQSFSYANSCFGDTTSQLPQSIFSFSGGTYSASAGMTINPLNGRIMPANALPGTYTVTYYAGNCDCPGTPTLAQGSATFTIFSAPVLTLTASQSSVCVGQQATLTVNGANSYSWNSGPTSFSLPVLVSIANINTWTVTGFVGICSSQKTISVFGLSGPTINVVSTPTALCEGQQATVTASGANTYQWLNGPSNATFVALATGTTVLNYNVTGIDINGCTASAQISIPVLTGPSLSITSTHTIICTGVQATLTASGANTYTWSTGINGAVLTASAATASTLSYTVYANGANGCKGSKSISITVSACNGINEPIADNIEISIFPNPNSGEFTVTCKRDIAFILVNEIGQYIMDVDLRRENNYSLIITKLPAGVYFLKQKGSATTQHFKIVVTE